MLEYKERQRAIRTYIANLRALLEHSPEGIRTLELLQSALRAPKVDRVQRDGRVLMLYTAGKDVAYIASCLKVSTATVYNALKRAHVLPDRKRKRH